MFEGGWPEREPRCYDGARIPHPTPPRPTSPTTTQVQHDRLFTLFWVSPGRFIDAAPYMGFRLVRRKVVGGFRWARGVACGKGSAAVPSPTEFGFDEGSADATQGQIPKACAR